VAGRPVDGMTTEFPRIYRITFTGEGGPSIRAAFPDLETKAHDGVTVLSGEFADQPALFAVLDRVQSLGLDLVDVRLDGIGA
jgi:hypothetical protein